jgi:hypothetical protein
MDAEDLFGLPLDRFIAERTALSKALRADGRRDEAKEVAAIRKPSVAAWAVNQLVRTRGQALEELFTAGDALHDTQEQVLGGHGDAQDLRAAAERERVAVDELLEAGRGLLTSEGHELSAAVLERVSDTLHAAALDDDARQEVEGGRLQRELQHVGFGAGLGLAAAPAAPKKSSRRQTPAKRAKREDKPRDDTPREEQRRAAREQAAKITAARTAEADARRGAARARRALELAQERRDRAAAALTEAEQELEQAQAEADQAEDAHRTATSELEELRG